MAINDLVVERRERRERFLDALYEMSTGLGFVNLHDLQQQLGVDDQVMQEIEDDFFQSDEVSFDMSAHVQLTPYGKAAVEERRVPSGHPTPINVTFQGAVGAVQMGAASIAHVSQNIGSTKLDDFLTDLSERIETADQSAFVSVSRDDAKELVHDLKTEMAKTRPNPLRMTAVLTATAQLLTTVDKLQSLYPAFRTIALQFGIHLP